MRPLSSPARPGLRTWGVCVALFAGTVLLFGRAVGYGFTNYDDPGFVTQNPHVRGGLTWRGLAWAFTGRADYWHPLTWVSHMLDAQLYGDQAAGHHLTSVLWHAANAVLVFLVMRRLTGSVWTSAFSAALFAWHPLRVESVAWVAERKDVMSGFFFLLTLWAYAAYVDRRRQGRPAIGTYGLTLGLFLGGLMCKPVLVAQPLLLLALDFWPLRREGISRRALLLEKIPFLALSATAAILTVVMQGQVSGFVLDLPLGARLGNAFVSLFRYAAKFAWPFDLTAFYPHPGYWPAWLVVAAVLGAAAITGVAWHRRRDRPWVIVGWIWYVAMLLPSIGIVQAGFQSMADRYSYLPVLGAQLAVLWTLRDMAVVRARGGLAALVAAALLLGCAARTWDQESTWRDSVTLYRHALAVTTRNATAHALLAFTMAESGRLDEAADESRQALDINPRNETALTTQASVQERKGHLPEAVASCRLVLDVDPRNADVEFALGLMLLRLGQSDEAERHLRAAAAERPGTAVANQKIAADGLKNGRSSDAFVRYAAAIAINPRDSGAYVGLGLALIQLGRQGQALASFGRAAQLQPDNADAHRAWADALARTGRFADAVPHYERAVQLRPQDAGSHAALGYALFLTNRRDEAVRQWEEALRLDPDIPGLRSRLQKVLGGPPP